MESLKTIFLSEQNVTYINFSLVNSLTYDTEYCVWFRGFREKAAVPKDMQ
jgi:hypothetical protein